MIKIISGLTLCLILTSCNTKNVKEHDLPVATPHKDSSNENKITSQAQLEKMLDSLTKAGVNFTFTANGGIGETITEAETKNLKPANLKVLTLERLDSLITINKAKNLILHFWATWCAPCRKEFPELINAAKLLKNTEVILISSDYDSEEQKKKVLAVYNKLNTDLPHYIAQTSDKSDFQGKRTQITFLNHLGCKSDGGLPYNILIENKQVVTHSAKYAEVFDAVK